jgi:putative ABC transport system permease protein
MLKHLFKLIWNKRKQNFLLLSEILVSFMVIFAVFSFLTFYYQNYSKPTGLEYEKVWNITFDRGGQQTSTDSLGIIYDNLKKSLKAMPQIEEVSFSSSNIPYSNNTMSTGLTYNKQNFSYINNYNAEDGYRKVWNMNLIEGRWLSPEDVVSKDQNIVINESLKTAMFGKASAIGKVLGDHEDKKRIKVVGVVQDIKSNGDYWPSGYAMFTRIDTGYYKYLHNVLVRVTPNADAAFESQLYKFMANTFKGSAIEIQHVSEMRDSKNETTVIPMLIFITIASFLIINVALGLFGVLWYNINKRKGEIGLRRAIGASGGSVSYQLVVESLILATLSIVVGCFFAVQFPLLSVFDVPASVYLIAMLLSILFIYALVFACSLYPGKQAAAIQPAIALHEE